MDLLADVPGEVGEVYQTAESMLKANAQDRICTYAWMQISENTRRKVELVCLSGHDPYYGWKFVKEDATYFPDH